jgi:4-diphosphocytidyl-2-C-methyl-D-erythritol kinase
MVPIDAGNLVLAARDMLRDHFPDRELQPVSIALEKNLPVASGVGGGSSDASAALRALTAFWGVDPDMDALAAKALPLGADIPMCLTARPLVAGGIGDVLEPLASFPSVDAVLVNPGLPVSTPEVFRTLEKRDNPAMPAPSTISDTASLACHLAGTRNDLQAAAIALCPMIADVIESLTANGAAFARMSGSGATCFGLFDNPGLAAAAADAIGKQHPGWFVETCRIMGTEANGRN